VNTHPLALANIAFLEQGIDLLAGLTNELYVRTRPPAFGSAVGPHMRHNLDHYVCFLNGWRAGEVDYDSRERDRQVETDRDYCGAQIQTIIQGLREVSDEDGERRIRVKMDEGGPAPELQWSHTTVKRELQFLVSHTVHHYALIAVLLKLEGKALPAGFGVAPSTLRYEEKRSACAP